jgi:hypothetical protein
MEGKKGIERSRLRCSIRVWDELKKKIVEWIKAKGDGCRLPYSTNSTGYEELHEFSGHAGSLSADGGQIIRELLNEGIIKRTRSLASAGRRGQGHYVYSLVKNEENNGGINTNEAILENKEKTGDMFLNAGTENNGGDDKSNDVLSSEQDASHCMEEITHEDLREAIRREFRKEYNEASGKSAKLFVNASMAISGAISGIVAQREKQFASRQLELTDRNKILTDKLQVMSEENRKLREVAENAADDRVRRLSAELNKLQELIKSKDKEMEDLNKRNVEIKRKLHGSYDTVNALKSEVFDIKQVNLQLTEEVEELQKELDEYKSIGELFRKLGRNKEMAIVSN